MVTISTNTRGATYVMRRPTFKKGKNWETAISKKNILKKNLNSLYKRSGKNVKKLYF
jgi:hypothetical protein